MLRHYKKKDCQGVLEIYNYYILNTHHTFETEALIEDEMADRIHTIAKDYPFIVYEDEGKILGYAYASRWKARQAYDQTVESSVYIKNDSLGKGLGTILCSALIEELKKMPIHCVLAGISLPNPVSISLHEKLGFKKSGILREVGFKFNSWIDVGYWQLEL